MSDKVSRNLGEQPIAGILEEHHLVPHDLVEASDEQITHKMVQRAMKGRRLTKHVQVKIMNALNAVAKKTYTVGELFNY